MATYSSILAGKIPWIEEPGGLQLMGSQELDRTEQLTLSLHFYFKYPRAMYGTYSNIWYNMFSFLFSFNLSQINSFVVASRCGFNLCFLIIMILNIL